MAEHVDHGAVHAAERKVGDQLEAERQARVAARDSLAGALLAFQAEMPKVHRGKTARIPTSSGGSYSYTYADLADVWAAVAPLLTRFGLIFTCLPTRVESGGYELVGRLWHAASGEMTQGSMPILGRTAQEMGSSLTYNRRYLLGCLLGVITDDDDDGQAGNAAPPTSVDRSREAQEVWQTAQETATVDGVTHHWYRARDLGLLDVMIQHPNGESETLRAALDRYGHALRQA